MAAGASSGASGRDARTKAKELAEQRTYGLAPLALDAVTGEQMSPHIPASIATVPWYNPLAGTETLAHQRKLGDTSAAHRAVDGSAIVGGSSVVGQAKKFRAGACTNCGSMTHKLAECTERRRMVGAKHAREGEVALGADVRVDNANWEKKTYEEKRDRSAGVNVDATVWAAFQNRDESSFGTTNSSGDRLESAVKALRTEGNDIAAVASESGSLLGEERALPKYLVNLNAGSAHYDPATRALRGNPLLAKSDEEAKYVVKSTGFQGDLTKLTGGEYATVVQQMAFLQRTVKDGEAGTGITANSMFLPTANEEAFKAASAAEQRSTATRRDALDSIYGPQPLRPESQLTPPAEGLSTQ
jgi:pre-mRNA-processing factor SLU7